MNSWPTLEHLGWGPRPPLPLGVAFPGKGRPLGGEPLARMGWGVDVHGPRGPSSFQPLATAGEQAQHQGPDLSQGREAPSPALGDQSNQVYVV